MPCTSAAERAVCQRENAVEVMPSACTASASCLMASDIISARSAAALVRFSGAWVIAWLAQVTATRMSPPATENQPKSG